MTVKISVGPPVLTINKGSTFMVTDLGGEISPRQAQGVFAADTRFVSRYRLLVGDHPWQRVSAATVSYQEARVYLSNPTVQHFQGSTSLEAETLALVLARGVDEGVQEDFRITNYSLHPVSLVFQLEIASDFADLFEVKAGRIRQRGSLVTEWDGRRCELTTRYRREDFFRRFTYRIVQSDHSPSYANGRLLFPIDLKPGATWVARGHMILQFGEHVLRPRRSATDHAAPPDRTERLHERWIAASTRVESTDNDFDRTYLQSVEDMAALRLYERDLGPDVWVPAAGVPWFVTLFGRDSLIAALQNLSVRARFAEGALRTLANHQATERDDWRDAQPGKIVHEVRHGELAHFDVIPQSPAYYGTWDATSLYLILLEQAWRWLGDRKLVEELLPTAERCLEWIDQWGDLDGDGFQEYQTFSPEGYDNMGWKDAGDAVVYPDGSQVKQPKALCELQGYVYAAKQGMADIYAAFGQPDRAATLRDAAERLKQRFNAAFWMEDEGTFAFALDPDKQQVRSVASNAGQCLWSGIADADKAARVAKRLLQPDMWSGWGIRTLSKHNPAYDPYSYQRGSVWPHDNGIIALGLQRYGLHAEVQQVARAIFAAAARFQSYRLPEVFAGIARQPESFPVQYRGANIPQAWAAGSVFHLVHALLGLEPDAPSRRLKVAPALPDWLPTLTVRGLQVGGTRVTLRCCREQGHTRCEVLEQHGPHLAVDVLQAD